MATTVWMVPAKEVEFMCLQLLRRYTVTGVMRWTQVHCPWAYEIDTGTLILGYEMETGTLMEWEGC